MRTDDSVGQSPSPRTTTPSPQPTPAPAPAPPPAVSAARRAAAAAVVVTGLLALAAPVVVLMGAPRGDAAFGDEVAVMGEMSAATLDVEAGSRTVPIGVGVMAPGDRATGAIDVVNAGSLPLRYALVVEPKGVASEDWLRWDVWPAPPGQGCGVRVPDNAPARAVVLNGPPPQAVFGDPASGLDPGDRVLAPGDRELLCMAVSLPLGAPDSIQSTNVAMDFVVNAEHNWDGER